jgi:hypothetical protein
VTGTIGPMTGADMTGSGGTATGAAAGTGTGTSRTGTGTGTTGTGTSATGTTSAAGMHGSNQDALITVTSVKVLNTKCGGF